VTVSGTVFFYLFACLIFKRKTQVGFTQLERWLCFSAVKNNLADAAAKAKSGCEQKPQ
jgi:hypothetical protein